MSELLLGGNWQKFALCITLKKSDANKLLLDGNSIENLAKILINDHKALTPYGENEETVLGHIKEAKKHFGSSSDIGKTADTNSTSITTSHSDSVGLSTVVTSSTLVLTSAQFKRRGEAEQLKDAERNSAISTGSYAKTLATITTTPIFEEPPPGKKIKQSAKTGETTSTPLEDSESQQQCTENTRPRLGR